MRIGVCVPGFHKSVSYTHLQYMWPYYKKDVIDEKNITKEEALELVKPSEAAGGGAHFDMEIYIDVYKRQLYVP